MKSSFIHSGLLVGANLVISGAGGIAGWSCFVPATTDLVAPQWPPIATGQFDAGGNFIFTNAIYPNSAQTFYGLQLQ